MSISNEILSAQISALSRQVAKCCAVTSAGPKVDFIIDKFDRTDADSLGAYWGATSGWAVRSNRAVLVGTLGEGATAQFSARATAAVGMSPPLRATTLGGSPGSSDPQSSFSAANSEYTVSVVCHPAQAQGFQSSATATPTLRNKYQAALSEYDFSCKVVFEIPASGILVIGETLPGADGGTITSVRRDSIQTYLSGAGASLATASGAEIAVRLLAASIPAITSGGASASGTTAVNAYQIGVDIPPITSRDKVALFSEYGKLSGITLSKKTSYAPSSESTNIAIVNDPYNPGVRMASAETVNTAYDLASSDAVVGDNTLLMTVTGGSVTVSLNGVVQHAQVAAVLIDRTIVGLCAYDLDTVACSTANNIPFYGIKMFKVWVPTVPEPGEAESGHGVADSTLPNGAKWLDKYHTPVKDPSTGAITRYTYDPNA